MSVVKLLDHGDASAEAQAVFDDIKAARNVADVNNFWKALAHDPAFAEAAWALSAAEPLSEPFVTSYGVHVALLLEEVPPMTRTDDEARVIVRADLIQRARAEGARSLVLGLRQRQRVQIREAALQQVERLSRRAP